MSRAVRLERLAGRPPGAVHAAIHLRLRAGWYRLWFRGQRYQCPFCHQRFARFLPGGSRGPNLRALRLRGFGRRPNARCPACGSNDRARLLWLYLERVIRVGTQPLRILHVAPDAHLARALRECSRLTVVFGALHPEDYSNVAAVAADVEQLSFADNAFDLVLCNHVLQEVPDDRRALRELYRVLRPGGHAILQAPMAMALERTREAAEGLGARRRRRELGSTAYRRLYGRDYAERVAQAGFQVAESHPQRDGWALDAPRWALNPDETVTVARKPLRAATS